MVVFVFLRNLRATMIPGVAVPLSLIGTFGVMYLCGYSLDNLSLMALTISTGFVVDDAIVVIENITRYLEQGVPPFEAALRGAQEIGFTVVLDEHLADRRVHPDSADGRHRRPAVPRVRGHAVGGDRRVDGRLAHDHADDVRELLKLTRRSATDGCTAGAKRGFDGMHDGYEAVLAWVLRHQPLTSAVFSATIGVNIYLYVIPKGFFPQQDTGRLSGTHHGRPGHVLSGDAARMTSSSRCGCRPGCGYRHGVRRRQRRQRTPRACSSR